MRLLQMHEYLKIVEGMGKKEMDDLFAKQALKASDSIWSEAGMSFWKKGKRTAEAVFQTPDNKYSIVNINTDGGNTYIALIYDSVESAFTSYFVFDVPEYNHAKIFECPYLNYIGPVKEEIVSNGIRNMHICSDPYAIVELQNGTFMQALFWKETIMSSSTSL